jgi:hypothetical protein
LPSSTTGSKRFVVTYAITAHTVLSGAVAALMAVARAGLWFAFPAHASRKYRDWPG